MLLQSAHTASRAGMGATCHLLKKAFYWPSLDEDARRYSWACKVQRRLRTGRGRRGPPQEAGDGTAGTVNAPDREPTRPPHLASGPATTRQRVRRRPQTLRSVNPRPDVTHSAEHQPGHLPYEPVPVAELARFAARQPLPQIVKISAAPEPVPQLQPVILARLRGPATCPAPHQGENDEEELHQRFEEVTEALHAAAERLRAMDHKYEMLARQGGPSGEKQDPDQAAPDQTPTDQAGLIAEGDVPSPDCSCCGLPIARPRPCPH